MQTRTSSPEAFLRALYGDVETGYVCLWTFPDKNTRWFPVQELSRTAADAIEQARTKNVYFGIGLHATPLGSGSRGEASAVQSIPGLWLEIDIAGPAHKRQDLPANQEEALALVGLFPHPPSWIVSSGHGLHLWWLFREPWVLNDDTERQTAHTLVRRLQRWFQEKARERGWHIDSTNDLARVLRLPGTINRKPGLAPVPVETLHEDESQRYSVRDFDTLLPDVEEYAVRWEPRADGTFPLVSIDPIITGCAWLRHCRDEAKTLAEPDWYAMLSILARCQAGESLAHAWSEPYPGYDREETARKLAHASRASGPRTCANIRYALESAFCAKCPHWRQIRSPILLAMPREERPPMPGDADIPPGRDTALRVFEADQQANAARQKLEEMAPRNGRPIAEKRPLPTLYSAADLQHAQLPELRWAVEGFIPEGVTLLVAHSKIGKTFLAEDVAVSIALGGRAWGKIAVEHGPVIYVDTEGSKRRVQRRIRSLLGIEIAWPADLLLTHDCLTLNAQGFRMIQTLIEGHPGLRLLVLDTLNAMRPGQKPNANLVKEDYDLIRALRSLGEAYRCALLLLHHRSLTQKTDSVNAAAGTHGLAAAASVVLSFERTRGEHDGIMEVTGNDIEQEGRHHFRRDPRTGFWTLHGSADDFMKTRERQAVFDLLLTQGGLPPAAIALALDRPRDAVKKLCRRMTFDGDLTCNDGVYDVQRLRS